MVLDETIVAGWMCDVITARFSDDSAALKNGAAFLSGVFGWAVVVANINKPAQDVAPGLFLATQSYVLLATTSVFTRSIACGMYALLATAYCRKKPVIFSVLCGVIVLAALLGTVVPCNLVAWAGDALAFALCTALWLFKATSSHQAVAMFQVLLCYAEFGIIVLFFVYDGQMREKESHLTWWGLGSLLVYVVAHGLDIALKVYYGRAFVLCRAVVSPVIAVVQTTVALGTVMLSVLDCGLLQSAFETHGAMVYGVGNFLMHYYPVARRLLSAPRVKLDTTYCIQILIGFLIVCVYGGSVNVASEYDCYVAFDESHAPLMVLALAVSSGIICVTSTAFYPLAHRKLVALLTATLMNPSHSKLFF